MTATFNPALKAHELPRETLVDLWRRTAQAHEALRDTWPSAVADAHGMEVANAIAVEGWPLKSVGATPRELFFDDLRFIVAATELKPDMLTVASPNQAETPHELRDERRLFDLIAAALREQTIATLRDRVDGVRQSLAPAA